MFINYFKGEPNQYVIRYKNGKVAKHGEGLDFWYLPYNTSIAVVNSVSQDALFIFNESTANFQEVAIQGQLTYRFEAPLEAAKYLDFSIQPRSGKYRSKDVDKLNQRVINAVQLHTRKGMNGLALDRALTSAKELSSLVLKAVRDEESLKKAGCCCREFIFHSNNANT